MKVPFSEPHAAVPTPRPRRRQPEPIDSPAVGPLKDYSKTPWSYMTCLIAGKKLCGTLQRDLIMLIEMRTWGALEKQEWARLSVKEICQAIPDSDPRTVQRAIANMHERGLIDQKSSSGCKTAVKSYKLTPERWADAPPYEAPKLKTDTVEDEESEEETTHIEHRTRASGDKMLVRPGRKAACVPARIAPKDRDPLDFKIQYANEGDQPVEVSASSSADILLITVSAKSAGEQKANAYGLEPVSKNYTPESNQHLTEFASVVKSLLDEEFEKGLDTTNPADLKFVQDIATAAGSVTAADFARYATAEIGAMRKNRKPVSSGVLKAMALQCAKITSRPALRPPHPAPSSTPTAEDFAAAAALDEKLRREDPEAWEIIERQRKERA